MNYYNCTDPCRDGDVRVSEGTPQDGFLEYCVDGYWGVVCGNNWDNNEAEIACRQLGYQHSPGKYKLSAHIIMTQEYKYIFFSFPDTSYEAVFARRPDPLLMFLSYINCGGDETQLSQCPYLNNAGPTDGIVWEGDGKVYCPWGGYVDGLYEYQVAKVHCSGTCSPLLFVKLQFSLVVASHRHVIIYIIMSLRTWHCN